ncbi:MAG: YqhA family protein [Pirellula sp.]|jgi:uncharacterized membrane protein YqhA|nr:YqhA family protein [Pirellula sp.]
MLRKILEYSRYLLVLPVLGSLLLMVGVVVMGFAMVLVQEWSLFTKGQLTPKDGKQLTLTVVQTIDMFLVGAISYIVAVGIYKLFITEKDEQLLSRVRIEGLADLEIKIIGVVIVAMAVGFLGKITEAAEPFDVLQGGVGTAILIAALCLFIRIVGSDKNRLDS